MDVDNGLLKILKRIMLIAIGSGLITNALYIYGLAYYEGYIKRLGFEYDLFPITWDNSIVWSYHASRELGVSSIGTLNQLTIEVFLILTLSVYLIARLWMETSTQNKIKSTPNNKKTKKFSRAKTLYMFKKEHKWVYRILYIPLKWTLITEKSLIAFLASYFFMVFLFFIPVFSFIWVYFPIIGLNHGDIVGEKHSTYYQENLCGDKKDYWDRCITFPLGHVKQGTTPKQIKGTLMFKNGDILGILSEEGPTTITIPKNLYHQTIKNKKYVTAENNVKTNKQTKNDIGK